MTTKKTLLFVTGTRSDFATIKGIYKYIEMAKNIQPRLFVTGMHTRARHGSTYKEILSDGISIDFMCRVRCQNLQDDFEKQIYAANNALKKFKVDYLILCGDRPEMLAVGVSALMQRIPIFHIHGGDVSFGMTDDSIRHAITKISAIHFTASSLSAKRVLKMGEEKWRVFCTGSPDLDEISKMDHNGKSTLEKYSLRAKDYCILLLHPEPLIKGRNKALAKHAVGALEKYGKKIILIYPNNDPYADLIVEAYSRLDKKKYLHFKTLPRQEYLHMLKHAEFLAGNSSSGIIEAQTLRVPVLNLGHRQDGRQRNLNVIDVPDVSKYTILSAMRVALSSDFQRKLTSRNVYGSGNSSRSIAELIKRIVGEYSTRDLLYKKFVL